MTHARSRGGFLSSTGGIAVPGGIVTIEPHPTRNGRIPRARIIFRSMFLFGADQTLRDIVVWDESKERQLYRDGPYDAITVNNPLLRTVDELKRVGVPEFIARRGGAQHDATVSVTQTTLGQMERQATITWFQYYWDKLRSITRLRR